MRVTTPEWVSRTVCPEHDDEYRCQRVATRRQQSCRRCGGELPIGAVGLATACRIAAGTRLTLDPRRSNGA